MRKRRTLLAIVCLAGLLGFVASVLRDQQPSYNGHKLTEWLYCYQGRSVSSSVMGEKEAEKAVRAIGTNAIPYLLKWIDCETGRPRRGAYALAVKVLPVNTFNNPTAQEWLEGDRNARANAATVGFLILGPVADPAIPELIRLSRRPRQSWTSTRATVTLGHLGKGELPALCDIIADPQHPNRELGIQAIELILDSGGDISDAVPALQRCLADQTFSVSAAAAALLDRHGKMTEEAPTGSASPLSHGLH